MKGVFVPGSIDVAGQRFNIGDMNYVVRGKIADGEYQVECETAGKAGNQFFGAMIPMEYIKGLQSAELTGILIRRSCGRGISLPSARMPLVGTGPTIWKRRMPSRESAGRR